MRLTKATIRAINNTKTRTILALGLSRSDQRIIYLLKHNPDNSILTTASALRIIKEQTGMIESDILEDVQINEPATSTR